MGWNLITGNNQFPKEYIQDHKCVSAIWAYDNTNQHWKAWFPEANFVVPELYSDYWIDFMWSNEGYFVYSSCND